jgi:urea transport system permease protein
MTLAMLGAWYSMAYDMQPFTNVFNGISPPNAFEIFGVSIDPYSSTCYLIAFGTLALLTVLVKLALSSKLGTIIHAIRDDAERVRFLGYSVSLYQTVVFTASGFIAALAGMLWVVVVQYVSPTSLEIVFSIQMVIWAAIGGRLSLLGSIIGAILINGAQSYVGDAFQSVWFLFLGGIFVLVVVFLPSGLAGLLERLLRHVSVGRHVTTNDALVKKTG